MPKTVFRFALSAIARERDVMPLLLRAIAFFVTGESDENDCRATASVARQAMRLPTNSALTLEYAELGAANVRQLGERNRSTNCESVLRVWAGNHKTRGEMIKGSQLLGRAVIDMTRDVLFAFA